MRIIECDQLSSEWFAARRGIVTASQAHRLITPKTGRLSAQADSLICELLAELYAPEPPSGEDKPETPAMKHGTDCEPEARRYYSLIRDVDVQRVGFCLSDCGRYGSSPDFLVGEEGAGELKCPQAKTQIAYLLDGGLPDEYKPQVHFHLLVTGREYVDFLSYARGLPPLLVRVVPDDFTKQLAAALDQFLVRFSEAKAKIDALRPEVAA